jgi:hypothetical protein
MRIAIFGLTKTGTSALYAKLREAMPANTECFFEPGPYHLWSLRRRRFLHLAGIRRNLPLLVKFLPFHPGAKDFLDRFEPFDHEILINRDPRDRLISGLLYQSFDSQLPERPKAARSFLDRLEAKQQDPASIGVVDLMRELKELQGINFVLRTWLEDYGAANISAPLSFAARRKGIIPYAYEDLVGRDFDSLAKRTGLVLTDTEPDVGHQLQRVVRSKGSGDWRNWFTPQDIDILQPVLQPYLDAYYPQADWKLPSDPAIDPSLGSLYVARIMDERRAAMGLPPAFGETG